MARPFKLRCIGHVPGATVFKPAGVPARSINKVTLHLDELEALRLVNLEGLDQREAAQQMGVSRPTVGRILKEACRKVTSALVQGDALLIEHGSAPLKPASGSEAEIASPTGAKSADPCKNPSTPPAC